MMIVTCRGDVPKDIEVQLVAAVPPSIPVHTENLVAFSTGGIPPWIELLGNAIDWKEYLGDAAKYILSALGGALGVHAKNNALPWLRNAKAKVLLDLALAIHSIRHANDDNKVSVAVGLHYPYNHYGTCFSVRGDSIEELAFNLAMFVHEAESVEKLF